LQHYQLNSVPPHTGSYGIILMLSTLYSLACPWFGQSCNAIGIMDSYPPSGFFFILQAWPPPSLLVILTRLLWGLWQSPFSIPFSIYFFQPLDDCGDTFGHIFITPAIISVRLLSNRLYQHYYVCLINLLQGQHLSATIKCMSIFSVQYDHETHVIVIFMVI